VWASSERRIPVVAASTHMPASRSVTATASHAASSSGLHVVPRLRVPKRLLPPMDDRFSARRGTYTIICRIEYKNRILTVVDVDHRRDVYRS
jgi:mRNA-degrading endonuclease RelE of RelBE toxin-antitoxin system